MVEDQGAADDGPTVEGATAPKLSGGPNLDEPICMKENVRLGPFQECRMKLFIGESAEVMVTPLKAGEYQLGGVQPLPPEMHVLYMYIRIKMGNGKVSVVVRNQGCRWHGWF